MTAPLRWTGFRKLSKTPLKKSISINANLFAQKMYEKKKNCNFHSTNFTCLTKTTTSVHNCISIKNYSNFQQKWQENKFLLKFCLQNMCRHHHKNVLSLWRKKLDKISTKNIKISTNYQSAKNRPNKKFLKIIQKNATIHSLSSSQISGPRQSC